MPPKSEQQRKFFGAVMSAKTGNKNMSKEAKGVAKKMSKEKIKHYLKKEDINISSFKEFFTEVRCPGGKIRSGGMGRGLGIGGCRGPIGRRRFSNRRIRRSGRGRGLGPCGCGLGRG